MRLPAQLRAVVGSLAALLLLACSHAPTAQESPRRETILVTEHDDARAAVDATREVIAELGLVQDEALQTYVSEVGQRLVRHAPQRPFTYRFFVVDQWSPNAFALPGGAIFVSRGALVLADSEDELANVLGHEIVHAAERHAAGRQVFVQELNPFSLGLMRAAQIAAYARDQERAADRGGQAIAAAAGYDPAGMASFLGSLDGVERLRMGRSRLPTFLDTHPGTTERLASTAARAQHLPWTRRDGGDRETYLRRIEGLVLGPNPAEGVLRGGRFLHPDLDFAVNFPAGWQITNTHSAVVATSPDGQARFALESAGRGEDPRLPAGAFLAARVEALGAQIVEARTIQLACCPAFQIRGHAPTQYGAISGQMTWLAYAGYLYRLTAAARSHVAEKYLGRAQAMARSFRALTDDERASVEVDRLRLVRGRAGETLQEVLERSGSSWDALRAAVGNDLPSTARLGEDRLLKVAVREPYSGR